MYYVTYNMNTRGYKISYERKKEKIGNDGKRWVDESGGGYLSWSPPGKAPFPLPHSCLPSNPCFPLSPLSPFIYFFHPLAIPFLDSPFPPHTLAPPMPFTSFNNVWLLLIVTWLRNNTISCNYPSYITIIIIMCLRRAILMYIWT